MKNDTEQLTHIYNAYFKNNNCSSLQPISNRFSRVDAILQSGNTSVIVEYKNRNNSVADYRNCMIERQKIDNLEKACNLFDAPAFLILEYNELILVFHIHFRKFKTAESMPCPISTTGNKALTNKEVYFLEYAEADFIISKKFWTRATTEQLSKFIRLKRNGTNY